MTIARPDRRRLLQASLAGAAATALPAWAQKAAPAARTLRVGHQKGWHSILKARGTLEKRLAPLGVAVTWTEFNAGSVQLEALNVGAIDFGDVGEAPPIFAQAAGAPLVYAGATVPRPRLEAVIVPQRSPIRTVADLKGKRIGYNKGSNVQYFLVKLLEKHGLKYADVQSIFLPPPDARAAFERGAIDAWIIWDPFYAAAELSQVLGLDRAITERYLARAAFGTAPVTREILAGQQAIADTFFQLKLIPKKPNLLHAAPVDLG